jgi:hypothetical protein
VCEFENQPQNQTSQTFQKCFWHQKRMLNPKKVFQAFFYRGLFLKKRFYEKQMCCFLVENCTLAKNESRSAILNQKQHIFSHKNAVFFLKTTIKKCYDDFLGIQHTVLMLKPHSECMG